MKVYALTIRNRPAALALGLLVLGAGAALLLVGIAILAAIAIAGGVLGTGIMLYRAIRGGRRELGGPPRVGFDPSLEVFPAPTAIERPARPNEETPRLPAE